jgi:hypothetical protein
LIELIKNAHRKQEMLIQIAQAKQYHPVYYKDSKTLPFYEILYTKDITAQNDGASVAESRPGERRSGPMLEVGGVLIRSNYFFIW